jgi:hypothetical protein
LFAENDSKAKKVYDKGQQLSSDRQHKWDKFRHPGIYSFELQCFIINDQQTSRVNNPHIIKATFEQFENPMLAIDPE